MVRYHFFFFMKKGKLILSLLVLLTCPLKMHQILGCDIQIGWEEIILHGRVSLHDIASLASHLKVHNLFVSYGGWARLNPKHVRTILKDTTVLGCVDGQTHRHVESPNVNGWILFDWRCCTVLANLIQ